MKAKELERYSAELLARRDELWARGVSLPPPGTTKGDMMDMASADAEADLQLRFRETDRQTLRDIDEALARIRAGSYGVCGSCGKPITKARLEAVPWARMCRDCEERQQS